MNCKHVEELLPLYIGRDLEEGRARQVTAHVQSCTQCARSAQEYGEANQLLQVFEPPQFSEASFAAVRSRVLREIERESSAQRSIFALEFLRHSFQPRVMWAVSTAVLLAVCLFAYYFTANRGSGPQSLPQRAENGRPVDQKTTAEQASARSTQGGLKGSPGSSSKDTKPAVTGNAHVPPALATHSPKSRSNRGTQIAWLPKGAGGAPAVPVRTVQNSSGPKGAAPDTSATAEKTLRLELQTTNPNIRIIWFSHSSQTEGSPSESSKGI